MEDIVHTPELPYRLQLEYNISNPNQDLKWSTKMLLQYGRVNEPQIPIGKQNLIPNLKLYNPMVLVIVSLLGLLCTLHSSIGSSN